MAVEPCGPEPIRAEVKQHRGAPALFLNGRAHTGLMFWHSRLADAAREIALFGDAGVSLFTTGFGLAECMREDGGTDFSGIDAKMSMIEAANPKALVLPRVGLEPPVWWHERHPGQMAVHIDLGTGERLPMRVSFASRPWRRDLGAVLAAFVRYCEEHYGDRVFGYQPCAGDCGEWAYSWRPVLSDFSRAQTEALREWLRQRYGGDVAALRRAWNDPRASFETAEVPADRTRPAGVWPRPWVFLDPERERRIVDYQQFHSWVVADAILHFCATAKDTLSALGRRKVCGVFYGYHFVSERAAHNLCNSGHHASAALLDSPYVDFICAPISYQERHPGGMYASQLAAGSLRLHGKLYYAEDDTFTFRARKTPWRYCCPDRETTINILRRNFAGALADGGTQWWMDHDGEDWYADDELMREIAAMGRLALEWLDSNRESAAQIVAVVSERSIPFLRHDCDLIDPLLARQLSELAGVGAPVAFIDAGDLELLFSRPEARRVRLVIFLDVLRLGDDERRAIHERVARDGRVLLWIYAPGVLGDGRVSEAAMASLTGMRLRLGEIGGPQLVSTPVLGSRLTFGTEADIWPPVVGQDPSARELGVLLHRGEQGFMERRMEGWTSVWSAAPNLPACLLRHLARQAGVHIFSDAGDQIMATSEVLALHANSDGTREVRLPSPAHVTDAFSGSTVVKSGDRFQTELARGETRVWRLAPGPCGSDGEDDR